MGYLPAGLRNYLARLGWSHGDDEIFSTAQMIEWFDIDDINKAPGRLDFAKLADVNGHYIRQASDDELLRPHQGLPARGRGRARDSPPASRRSAGTSWRPRCPRSRSGPRPSRSWSTAPATCWPRRPLALDDKAAKLLDADGARDPGQAAGPVRGASRTGQAPALEAVVRDFAEQERPEARQGRPAAARRADRLAPCRRPCSTSWPCWAATRPWPASATRPR